MKILHIANTNHFSGAENVICQINNLFLDNENVEMVYVSPDGQIREALKDRGMRFHAVDTLSVKALKKVFAQEQPDIVHAHDMRASLITALACGKTKLVLHLHNNQHCNRRISKKSLAYLIPARKASHIFFVSKSTYTDYYFHQWFKNKSSVLYNIIDVASLYDRMALDKNDYAYDVVYLGRLTYQKHPERLVDVLESIAKMHPNLRAAIVGTGELEADVKAYIARKHLEKNIAMLGFHSNPVKLLADAKVMLMTSRWEGTPMCALESMAVGTPIVTTPTDGLVDLIDDGVTGFLSDNDDVLSEKVSDLITNDTLYQQMSIACKKQSKKQNDAQAFKYELMKAYGLLKE